MKEEPLLVEDGDSQPYGEDGAPLLAEPDFLPDNRAFLPAAQPLPQSHEFQDEGELKPG